MTARDDGEAIVRTPARRRVLPPPSILMPLGKYRGVAIADIEHVRRPAHDDALGRLLRRARRLWRDHLAAELVRDRAHVHGDTASLARAQATLAQVDRALTTVEVALARLDAHPEAAAA